MWKLAALAITLAGIVATWGGVTLASVVTGGSAGILAGTSYNIDLNVQSDPAQHDSFIWGGPPPHNLKIVVLTQQGRISICAAQDCAPSSSHWVDVHGDLNPDGSFSASGNGQVADCPNAIVTFVGTYSPSGGPQGKYTMGAQGELPCSRPSGQPAVYQVKPHKRYSIIVINVNDNNLDGCRTGRCPSTPVPAVRAAPSHLCSPTAKASPTLKGCSPARTP